MTTSEQARELANVAEKIGANKQADALRDLARQVEELQTKLDFCEDMLLEAREFGDRQ